jgi:hypothetical protein
LRLVSGRLEGCVDTKAGGHVRSLILKRTNVRRDRANKTEPDYRGHGKPRIIASTNDPALIP